MKSLLGKSSRRPDISFRADGRIDITSRIAKDLSLAPGDIIDIAEPVKGEYCLFVRHRAGVIGRHIGRCYPVIRDNTSGSYRAWSKKMYYVISDLCDSKDPYLSFPCGKPFIHESVKFIPIILGIRL